MPLAEVSLRLCIKNILFTTDFTGASDAALPYVLRIARWYGSKIFIAHAVRPEPNLSVPLDPVSLDTDANWEQGRKKMDDFLHTDPFRSTCHEVILEQGELWDVLSDVIKRHQIDMVVLGTHGRHGLKKLVIGSAAEQIFRRAFCPVLTVGPKVENGSTTVINWKNILFATDFSAGSLSALPYALSLSEENKARLILLHLIPSVPIEHEKLLEDGARKRLEMLVPAEFASGCRPECVVGFEFPVDGILRAAEDCKADLIVMGVHRSPAPRTLAHLPWATAYEVVSHAPCPVLTVRD